MSCCMLDGTDRFFSKTASYYETRFRIAGLDDVQRIIVRSLKDVGLHGQSLLEIGFGVGGLHLTLLKEGARKAVGVEVSRGMIRKASENAREMNLLGSVSYVQGDFLQVADAVPPSSVVVLDKVVCCYSDPEALVMASMAKSTDLVVLSYPRDVFHARLIFKASAYIGMLFRWSFHPFFHNPGEFLRGVYASGFREVSSAHTWIWQVRVFRRPVKAAQPVSSDVLMPQLSEPAAGG